MARYSRRSTQISPPVGQEPVRFASGRRHVEKAARASFRGESTAIITLSRLGSVYQCAKERIENPHHEHDTDDRQGWLAAEPGETDWESLGEEPTARATARAGARSSGRHHKGRGSVQPLKCQRHCPPHNNANAASVAGARPSGRRRRGRSRCDGMLRRRPGIGNLRCAQHARCAEYPGPWSLRSLAGLRLLRDGRSRPSPHKHWRWPG